MFGALFKCSTKYIMAEEVLTRPISYLFGRKVYLNNGVYLGTVEDLVIVGDSIHRLEVRIGSSRVQALISSSTKGLRIPYTSVTAIKDVIIVDNILGLPATEKEASEFTE